MMNYRQMLQYMEVTRRQEFSNLVVGSVEEVTAPPPATVTPKTPMPPFQGFSAEESSLILC